MSIYRMTSAAAVAAAMILSAGCEYRGASSLPLPGAVGSDGYRVTVTFDDATNLVVKETCRANDVVVGSVESIELDDQLQARVVCRISKDVKLPANVVASIRETSLLGERYVGLDPPTTQQPEGVLAMDAVLPETASHVVPDVEVVFGALSQVLNGGGLASLETITKELNTAFAGSDVAQTTKDLGNLVSTLDANRSVLSDSLVSLNRLSDRLARQRSVIASALDEVPAGLAVLDRQRPRLIKTLRSLGDLSEVALPLIARTKANNVADLKHLSVILHEIGKEKDELDTALEGIFSFPFPSNTIAAAQGDYAGMFATFTLDADSLNTLLEQNGVPLPEPEAPAAEPQKPGLPGLPGLPQLPGLPELPGLPGLGGLPGLSGLLGGKPAAAPPARSAPQRPLQLPRTLGDLLMAGGS